MSRPSLVGGAGAGRIAPEIAKAHDSLSSSEQSEDSDSSAETGEEDASFSVAVGSKRPPSGDEGSDTEAAKKHSRGNT